MINMIGDLSEALGNIVGEYLSRYYAAEVLVIIIPLVLLSGGWWLASRFLTAQPEPDYRKAIIAVLGTLVALKLVALALVSRVVPDLVPLNALEIAFLGPMLIWMVVKTGLWPVVLLLGYAVAQLIRSIVLIFLLKSDSFGIACVLGFMVFYVGLLLWTIVALKVRKQQAIPAVSVG